MSDEIKAAAERLNDVRNNYYLDDVTLCAVCQDRVANRSDARQLMLDGITVARAYLASHPADADQPYSGDQWVESVGLQIGVTADKRGRWWAEAHQDGMRVVLIELKTMGQWRNLLAALGITPEGKPNGKA